MTTVPEVRRLDWAAAAEMAAAVPRPMGAGWWMRRVSVELVRRDHGADVEAVEYLWEIDGGWPHIEETSDDGD